MLKKIIPFILLPFQATADITWVPGNGHLLHGAVKLSDKYHDDEAMTFKYVDGRQFSLYQTYCSTDQSDAESSAGTGTLRGTLENTPGLHSQHL
jgi:hypothetical protein